MTHTPHTSPSPTLGEMVEELIDLTGGFVVVLLPAFLLAVPAVILVVVPLALLALALAIPVALIAVLIAAARGLARLESPWNTFQHGKHASRRRTARSRGVPGGAG